MGCLTLRLYMYSFYAQFIGYIKRNRGYYYYYILIIIIVTTTICENLRWMVIFTMCYTPCCHGVVQQWQNAYWQGGEQLQTHLTFLTEEHLWKETLNPKVFSAGITHVMYCWDKCLSHLGDYLEKQGFSIIPWTVWHICWSTKCQCNTFSDYLSQ